MDELLDVRSWPGRAEAVLRFVAGKLSFSYTLRQKIGAQVDRPLVADFVSSHPFSKADMRRKLSSSRLD